MIFVSSQRYWSHQKIHTSSLPGKQLPFTALLLGHCSKHLYLFQTFYLFSVLSYYNLLSSERFNFSTKSPRQTTATSDSLILSSSARSSAQFGWNDTSHLNQKSIHYWCQSCFALLTLVMSKKTKPLSLVSRTLIITRTVSRHSSGCACFFSYCMHSEKLRRMISFHHRFHFFQHN